MSDRPLNEIIGPEGLASTIAALASQLGALEKSTNQQFASLAQAVEMQAEGIRRETASEAQRLNTLLKENAEKSNLKNEATRDETRAMMERLRCEVDKMEETLRREQIATQESNRRTGEVIVSKYDGILASMEKTMHAEMASLAAVALERVERLQEVKNLHWHEHAETHRQEDEAIRVAQVAIDHRLDNLNHLNARIESMAKEFPTKEAIDKAVGNLESRLDRGELDTRQRFERFDAKLNTLEREMGIELRKEVRPVQDARVGQAAIWAAVVGAIAIISIVVMIVNFVTSR